MITPTTEGGYKVYVGSGGGAVVTVWINGNSIGDGGLYVVYDNDAAHYDLTATGDTWNSDFGETYRCYTAPLATGATTYTVWNGSNKLASDVNVSEGEILIYNGGRSPKTW